MNTTQFKPLSKINQYWQLTKPRVTQLAVFCAVIGMLLALPNWPSFNQWQTIALATVGIWLQAAGAFAFNCLLEMRTDAKMRRTAWRASASGDISVLHILLFAIILEVLGACILYQVSPLSCYLTLATFLGYAIIYTVFLKPNTPQNIVIGGLSGAMPPALGWAAMTGEVSPFAWVMVLIIFCWTPPHFWALCLYRKDDYIESQLPMLPITHGQSTTLLHMFLYSIILLLVSIMPYLIHQAGVLYLLSSLILSGYFAYKTYQLKRSYSDDKAKALFKHSIIYLTLLFAVLLIDHYILQSNYQYFLI